MNTPSNFEKLLSSQQTRLYFERRTAFRRLCIELGSNDAKLFALLGSDMIHFNSARKIIQDALCENSSEQNVRAIYWISFLKPRVELLEYQAHYFSSFAAYIAGASALLAFVVGPISVFASAVIAVAGGGISAMILSGVNVSIARRRAWYKYLVVHLEAIKEGSVSSSASSPPS
jgi:hypothetical protein